MKENIVGIALTKEACPVCGKLYDGAIYLNTRLTVTDAQNVEKLHGQTVGYMKHPCDECKKLMEMGVVVIIVNKALTDDKKNPYRTGEMAVLSENWVERCLEGEIKQQVLKKRVMFIYADEAANIGLLDEMNNLKIN